MFTVRWTDRARQHYDELKAAAELAQAARKAAGRSKSTRQEGRFKQVVKTIRLLSGNPRHPGLQTHEYQAIEHPYDKTKKVLEAYAQQRTPGAYRVFWCYGPERRDITIVAIAPHP